MVVAECIFCPMRHRADVWEVKHVTSNGPIPEGCLSSLVFSKKHEGKNFIELGVFSSYS